MKCQSSLLEIHIEANLWAVKYQGLFYQVGPLRVILMSTLRVKGLDMVVKCLFHK